MENNKKNSHLIDLVSKLLNEAKKKKDMKKSKGKGKEKMADKDYDGDGEVESSKDEYFGSKDKAIKKAMGKKEVVSKKKKKELNEGRAVSDGVFVYGGFPRKDILSEGDGAVNQFNDSDDAAQANQGENPIATRPDAHEIPLAELQKQLEKMQSDFNEAEFELSDRESRWSRTQAGRTHAEKIRQMEDLVRNHPESVAARAAAEAARTAAGPGFFSQPGGSGRGVIPSETLQDRGLRLGPRRLPPTDYDLGRSGRNDR